VKLITAAMREIARDKSVGGAEALRRAMLTLIDKGKPHEAHPAYWAPFIVVGEGSRWSLDARRSIMVAVGPAWPSLELGAARTETSLAAQAPSLSCHRQ
jgi:hypothetical protein